MLTGKISVFGKTIPVWLASLALLAATAGAATGIVLAGSVTGTVTSAVSQSLLVKSATVISGFGAVKDDETAFTMAKEIITGEKMTGVLVLKNASAVALTGQLDLELPPGVTANVSLNSASPDITAGPTRIGLASWKFALIAGAPFGPPVSDTSSDINIEVALADEAPPGFYTVNATIKQVAN